MKRAKILSASAGSGKTYQLTLKYLCDIIDRPDRYRNILAVTFTNKATEEMKSRILKEIHKLASGEKSIYLDNIIAATSLSEAVIRERTKIARTKILHDYSRFSVLTIDRFFQRILRAFIKELSLDLNYSLELNTELLLQRSADKLIESIATNKNVRKWLLDYAEERISDGSRWDMRRDLSALGAELFKEGGAKRMNKNIDKDELLASINKMVKLSDGIKERIKELSIEFINEVSGCGLTPDMFKNTSRSFVHGISAFAKGELKAPNSYMTKAVESTSEWYTKGSEAEGTIIAIAERLHPKLEEIYNLYNNGINIINSTRLLKQNYRSFALLADMQKNVDTICHEENIMILDKTKDLLSKFINDSNAPFIYEKVGSRYDHYMIDEFQDTSIREWKNLLPLLKEALDSNDKASVFIVGDVKQSIYRFKGGDWQLLSRYAIEDLGPDNTDITHLKTNYRSLPNIVEFNNKFIDNIVAAENIYLNTQIDTALSDKKISSVTHASLYDITQMAYTDHKQLSSPDNEDKGGYIEATLYDSKLTTPDYISAIEDAINRGYRYRDILILVRMADDGAKIAEELLTYKEQLVARGGKGFNILTPNALTLEASNVVSFIIAILRLAINPSNDIERGIYNHYLSLPFDHHFTDKEHHFLNRIAHLSPIEALEEIIANFRLNENSEHIASLQAIHEQIVSYTTSHTADIQQYLTWWDERGKKETITVEMTDNTIEITTIHKSKGLERDIIIIPNCKWSLTPSTKRNIVWAKADPKSNNTANIGDFPVYYSQTMAESDFSEQYYNEMVLSHIDGINLLYVAVTRAARELYLFIPENLNRKGKSKGSDNIGTTIPLICNALKNITPQPEIVTDSDSATLCAIHRYGSKTEIDPQELNKKRGANTLLNNYTSNRPNLEVKYPSQRDNEDVEFSNMQTLMLGIQLHQLFETAKTEADLMNALHRMDQSCSIDANEVLSLTKSITEALENPIIKEWFCDSWDEIRCEAEIISSKQIKRPDRVMIKGDRAVVVDYKFGEKYSESHNQQVERYMSILSATGNFKIVEGYVWYVTQNRIERVNSQIIL